MKLLVTAAAVCALAATPALAQNAERYVQGNLGASFGGKLESSPTNYSYDRDAKTGYFVSVAVGQSLTPKWTVEGEVLYTENDLDDPKHRNLSRIPSTDMSTAIYGAMVNAQYEVYSTAKTRFYAGAGVGFGYQSVETKYGSNGYTEEDSGLMWQAKLGATRALTEKVSLDVSYRYLVAPQMKLDYEKIDLDAHVLTAGMRYKF